MWSYEGEQSEEDKQIEAKFNTLFENEKVARGFTRFFSLYSYLKDHPPTSVQTIRTTVFMDRAGILPFFDEESAKRLIPLWKIIHNPTKFAEFFLDKFKHQKGGQSAKDEKVLDDAITYTANTAANAAKSAGFDPAAPGIRGIIAKGGSWAFWLGTFPVRILPWIEQNPYIGGPFFRVAIDVFMRLAPKIILGLQTVTPIIAVPLVPVFGIGVIIQTVSYLITSVLALITVFLSLARGKMGGAFLSFLQLIPFVGSFLRLGLLNFLSLFNTVDDLRPSLVKLPLVGRFFVKKPTYPQPPSTPQQNEQQPTGGRRKHHRRRTHKQFKTVGRARRRST